MLDQNNMLVKVRNLEDQSVHNCYEIIFVMFKITLKNVFNHSKLI